jgi:predicted ATPase/transcriptional regulator with XRE-family HTH domain
MESPVTFGEWLRQIRDELRITREEFSKRVGCSVAMLRKIEDGERRPSSQIAELIANSLDVPPADRPTFVKVARGELGVDRLFPIAQRMSSPNAYPAPTPTRINLPVLPTPLIGRQSDVEQLSQLLRDPQCRLLTLVGPGGIGKTRLAIESASHTQDFFADGVYFIPLALVNSSNFLVPVIAEAIGFAFQRENFVDAKSQLYNYLKEKHAVLIMDNLEHLLAEPGVELLSELLDNAPLVTLLVTSRESLGLHGEWVFEVHGLPVPESGYSEITTQGTSVELFLQRARRAHVRFAATTQDYPAILRICQLVGGMPLGIELAAAWVRTLSCEEIALEIERGLDFLSVSARDLPARHRSMRAVFEHSWKLLTEEEQRVLVRLSTFQGGFRREAAEVVAGTSLSVLSALVTKSLIRRSGAERYDLHELICQYASERLADQPEENTNTQARHARYYLTAFGKEDGALRSSAQREALARLAVEMDNFRIAWDWAVTHHEFALIEQTLLAFATYFDNRGRFQEGLDLLGRATGALEAANEKSPPGRNELVALGHLLACSGLLAFRLAQNDQAQEMLERSLEILRPLDEPNVLVESVTFLGIVLVLVGNYPKALDLFDEGLEIANKIGDRWFGTLCRTEQINLSIMMGKPEDAYQQLQSVVEDWRLIGDPRFTAFGLNFLSLSAFRLGRFDEARTALEESIVLNNSVGDRWGLGSAYRGLGLVAQAQGEHIQAMDAFHKSQDILTDLGARWDLARMLAEMGRSAFALGKDSEAEHSWRESLRISTETQTILVGLEAVVGMASLQAKRGEIQEALESLLVVLNHPAGIQETKNRASKLRDQLEVDLTPQEIEVVQHRAGEKTFNSIAEDILRQTGNA